ncbi:MAG: peptidyl-prolyl cis-trans isomerase [Cytophagales bacterium]|nr:peptidyl-prolyl cis-trans isomerase [Cytophagales bacterium]
MRITKSNLAAIWGISLLLGSCQWLGISKESTHNPDPAKKIIARVHSNSLYASDIENLTSKTRGKADSAQTVKRFVRAWIDKQLLMAEAKKLSTYNEAKIRQKVLDYQYALMAFEYERNYLNKNLDTEVSQEEIQRYYDSHKENFELKQNIVKGYLVKVSKKEPRKNLNRFRKWLRSPKTKDQEALIEFSYSTAANYIFELEQWMDFDQLVKLTPFAKLPNKVDFLKKNKTTELSDNEYVYFLNIRDYKITDQISPMQMVEDDIRKIILNKRKIALISALKEQIYKRAVKNNEFEIFENE